MKEALLSYEKVILHQLMKCAKDNDPGQKSGISELDKKHLF